MDYIDKDGQFGYLKDREAGVWKKIRLLDGIVVGEIRIDVKGIRTEHKGAHHQTVDHANTLPVVVRHKDRDLDLPLWLKEGYSRLNVCNHFGTVPVWTSCDHISLYGAGWGKVRPDSYDLVLDLANQVPNGSRSRWHGGNFILPGSPDAFIGLNKHVMGEGKPTGWKPDVPVGRFSNVIHCHWPDGDAPDVSLAFWQDLYEALPEPTGKGNTKVLCACVGSHGRTGTAMASLMMASGDPSIFSALQAVLLVRAYHCEMAIETRRQIIYLNYLAHELGLAENAKEAQRVRFGDSRRALADLLTEHRAAKKA